MLSGKFLERFSSATQRPSITVFAEERARFLRRRPPLTVFAEEQARYLGRRPYMVLRICFPSWGGGFSRPNPSNLRVEIKGESHRLDVPVSMHIHCAA